MAGAVLMPFIRIMYAVMQRFTDVDLATRAEVADLKLRWARNRYTSREERPCLAVAFVSDEPADGGSVSNNPDEMTRVLALDLIVDMEIETEASAEANEAMQTPIAEFDPSGLQALASLLGIASLSLRECCTDEFRDTTPLGRMTDWIEDVAIDDDEELPDDDGRLVGRINVLYRTSSWDPTVLLEREAP